MICSHNTALDYLTFISVIFLYLIRWYMCLPYDTFSNFSCMFLNPNLNSNCSNLLDLRNLQEQVKKALCCQKLFWPFLTNSSSDLKNFANSWLSASNFKSSLEQFFLTVGQNNFGNKIPFLTFSLYILFKKTIFLE